MNDLVKKEVLESLEIMRNCALDDIIHAESDSSRNYHLGRLVGMKIAQRIIEVEE